MPIFAGNAVSHPRAAADAVAVPRAVSNSVSQPSMTRAIDVPFDSRILLPYPSLIWPSGVAGYWPLNDSEGYAQAVLSDGPLGYWPLGVLSPTGSQLIANGSCEANSNWVTYVTPTSSAQSSARAHSGTFSWHVVADSGSGVQNTSHWEINGASYRFSAWVWLVNGSLIVKINNGAGTTLVNSAAITTTGSWQFVTLDYTENATGSAARPSFISQATGSEFYIDDISVVALNVALDSSGNNDDGVPVGGVTFGQTGPLSDGSSSALFDGATGYVQLPNVAALKPAALTFEAWVKPSATQSTTIPRLLDFIADDGSGNVGYRVQINNAAPFNLTFGIFTIAGGTAGQADREITASATVTAGAYHHVVATYDGRTSTLYVDNVKVTSTNFGSIRSPLYPAAEAVILGDNGSHIRQFTGTMAQATVYGYALSAQQVANHYALRTSAIATLTKATAADASVNGLTGTINGGVTLQQATNQPDTNAAALFDGVTSYVSIPDSSLLKPAVVSIEAWVKPAATQTVSGRIFERIQTDGAGNLGYQLLVGTTAPYSLQFIVFTSAGVQRSFTVNSAIAASAYSYVVATYDGQVSRIYVNGAQVGSNDFGSVANILHATASVSSFIGNSSGMNRPLAGTFNKVAVYGIVLTATQVAYHYYVGSGL